MTTKEWFYRAVVAKVASEALANHGDYAYAAFYREQAIYFLAKGLESLAFDSARAIERDIEREALLPRYR